MVFSIAFDESTNEEIILFRKVIPKNGNIYSGPLYQSFIAPLGTFLTIFLNIDFDDDMDFTFYIYNFCFESLYAQNHIDKNFSHFGVRLLL